MFIFPLSPREETVIRWAVRIIWLLNIVIIGWLLFSSATGCRCACRHGQVTVATDVHETPGANVQDRKNILEREMAAARRRWQILATEHEALCRALGVETEPENLAEGTQ